MPLSGPPSFAQRPLLRLSAVFLVLALAVIVPFLVWGEGMEASLTREGVVAQLGDAIRYAWLAGIALLISDLLLPIPNSAVMAALGVIYGPVVGGLVASAGIAFAGAVGFAICRSYGRPAALWLIGDGGIAEGERLFARAGGWLVALTRPVPILSEVVACMAGLAGMRLRPFMLSLLCGSLPFGFVMAAVGFVGAERPVLTLGLSLLLPLLLWAGLNRNGLV